MILTSSQLIKAELFVKEPSLPAMSEFIVAALDRRLALAVFYLTDS